MIQTGYKNNMKIRLIQVNFTAFYFCFMIHIMSEHTCKKSRRHEWKLAIVIPLSINIFTNSIAGASSMLSLKLKEKYCAKNIKIKCIKNTC